MCPHSFQPGAKELLLSLRAGNCSPVVVPCKHPNGSRIIRQDWYLHYLQLVTLGRNDSRGQELGWDHQGVRAGYTYSPASCPR